MTRFAIDGHEVDIPAELLQPKGPSWQRWGSISQIVASVAAIISACAAMAAVLGVAYQISLLSTQIGLSTKQLQENALNSRQSSTRHIYLAYMARAFENPQYVEPTDAIVHDPMTKQPYKWFVLYLLWACDEILDVLPHPPWINACEYDMKKHLYFLCTEFDYDMLMQYYDAMRLMITKLITEAHDARAPHCSAPKIKPLSVAASRAGPQ